MLKTVVKKVRGMGRGVFATKSFKKGDIVELSPCIKLDAHDGTKVQECSLKNYVFDDGNLGSAVTLIALGNGSLFNHSIHPNLTYKYHSKTNIMAFRATKPVKKGEQLYINYGYDPLDQKEIVTVPEPSSLEIEEKAEVKVEEPPKSMVSPGDYVVVKENVLNANPDGIMAEYRELDLNSSGEYCFVYNYTYGLMRVKVSSISKVDVLNVGDTVVAYRGRLLMGEIVDRYFKSGDYLVKPFDSKLPIMIPFHMCKRIDEGIKDLVKLDAYNNIVQKDWLFAEDPPKTFFKKMSWYVVNFLASGGGK